MKDTLKQLIRLTETTVNQWQNILDDPKKLDESDRTKEEVCALVNKYSGKFEAYTEILNYMSQFERYQITKSFGAVVAEGGHIKNVGKC